MTALGTLRHSSKLAAADAKRVFPIQPDESFVPARSPNLPVPLAKHRLLELPDLSLAF